MEESDDGYSVAEQAGLLRELHRDPKILVLVNAWDVISARTVAEVPGCDAVATASAAITAAHGFDDGEQIPVDLMLSVVGRIAAAVDLPVTADLEAGYGDVDGTVRRAVQLGVVGANIEDEMRPLDESVAMMRQAVRAGEAEGVPLVLNARTDCYLRGGDTAPEVLLAEATERGKAFLGVGAECVFVPGVVDRATIEALAERFGPGRLSVYGQPGLPTPAELAELGVARVSYGPFPQRRALAALSDMASGLLT